MAHQSNPTTAARMAQIANLMTGRLNRGYPRVAEALKQIDPETVSSATSIVSAYLAKRNAINADRELSAEGKTARIKAAADSTLGNIAAVARKVAALDLEHRQDLARAVPLPPADPVSVHIDIALARLIAEQRPIPTKLQMMSERVRLAVARLPAELSGIAPEVHAKVHGSLMDPVTAARLGDEAAALSSARSVAQAAIDEIAPDAKWAPGDLVQHFGTDTGFRLPGIYDAAAAARMAQESQAAA